MLLKATMPVFPANIPHPLELEYAFHYHHSGTKHPRAYCIAPFQELVEVVTCGRGWVRDGQEWREVLAGDMLWHSPGDETIGRADFENHYHCLAVGFRVRRAKGTGMPRFSSWADMAEVNVLANECSHLMLDEAFDRQVLRDYLHSRLVFQVRLSERASRASCYPAPLAAALARIERDFGLPLRLGDLARDAGWSVPHLHAEFQKHLQVSPHQMLMQKRLRVAKERLICTWDPVKRIAVECGFSDTAAFGHTFKAQTGQTPTEYREYHMRLG